MRYVGHLLDAYADHKQAPSVTVADLGTWDTLRDHF
jgi:hypothetical protein